jgi:hypothetical protein
MSQSSDYFALNGATEDTTGGCVPQAHESVETSAQALKKEGKQDVNIPSTPRIPSPVQLRPHPPQAVPLTDGVGDLETKPVWSSLPTTPIASKYAVTTGEIPPLGKWNWTKKEKKCDIASGYTDSRYVESV